MQRVLIAVSLFALTTFGSLSAQTPDQQQNTTAASSSVSGISDSDFALKAAAASMAEVELGQLASQKAQSPEVKQFAQRMVTDHTQANDQLKQAAQGQNITIPTSMGAEQQEMKDRLSNLSGSEFDREYMRGMVHDHQEALSLFRQEASNGQGALKSFAESMVPKLEEHYRLATDIASKLGSSVSTGDQNTPSSSTASSSTSTSSTDTSAQSLPRTDTDTAAPMVNNRTTEHGPEKDTSAAAPATTPSSDTSSASSSSSPAAQTEPSTQSSTSSSTSSSTDNTSANTNTTQGTATGSDQLPRTASPLPLIGLFGLMSLGVALFLHLRRRLN